MARWRASDTIRPMICSSWEAWPSTATSAAEGWLPTTEPIFVSTTSERRCSAVARPPVVARKRSGSAIRQVTRLWMTRFFLSSLRNSAVTGLRVSRRLSSRTTVSRGKGRLTLRPGSFTTRTTRPKRRKRPYSVTSTTTKQDQTASVARRPPTSARVRVALGEVDGFPREGRRAVDDEDLVLLRARDVAEGGVDLLGRVHAQQAHRPHADARSVGVERLLDVADDPRRHRVALGRVDRVDGHGGDPRPQGADGDALHEGVAIGDVVDEGDGVLDLVLGGERDVDDVR